MVWESLYLPAASRRRRRWREVTWQQLFSRHDYWLLVLSCFRCVFWLCRFVLHSSATVNLCWLLRSKHLNFQEFNVCCACFWKVGVEMNRWICSESRQTEMIWSCLPPWATWFCKWSTVDWFWIDSSHFKQSKLKVWSLKEARGRWEHTHTHTHSCRHSSLSSLLSPAALSQAILCTALIRLNLT